MFCDSLFSILFKSLLHKSLHSNLDFLSYKINYFYWVITTHFFIINNKCVGKVWRRCGEAASCRFKATESRFSILLASPPNLQVAKARASAFKSFHSLLTLNTETRRRGEKCKQLLQQPQHPSVSPSLFILRVSPKARAPATITHPCKPTHPC